MKPELEQALRGAILAAPDDDAPRLIYADALLDEGDPWGELIQIQVQLARDPDQPALMKREDELLAGRADRGAGYRRGFPWEVTMADRFAPEVLARDPIGALRLSGDVAAADVAAAARAGRLARIERLAILARDPRPILDAVAGGGAPRLAALEVAPRVVVPWPEGVTELAVPDAAGDDLAALPAGLRGLDIGSARRCQRIVPDALAALLGRLPALRRLGLANRTAYLLRDVLLEWAGLPGLEELAYQGHNIERIAAAAPALRTIDLDEAEAALLSAIADTAAAARLVTLRATTAPPRTNDELAALPAGTFPALTALALGPPLRARRDALEGLLAAAPRLGRLAIAPADDDARALLEREFPVCRFRDWDPASHDRRNLGR